MTPTPPDVVPRPAQSDLLDHVGLLLMFSVAFFPVFLSRSVLTEPPAPGGFQALVLTTAPPFWSWLALAGMIVSGAAVLLTSLRLIQAAWRLLRRAPVFRDRLTPLLLAALGFAVTCFMVSVAVPETIQTTLTLLRRGVP